LEEVVVDGVVEAEAQVEAVLEASEVAVLAEAAPAEAGNCFS
jgi:hypothetical protein